MLYDDGKIKFKDFPQSLKNKVLEIRQEQKYNPNHGNLDNHSLAMLFKFKLTNEGKDYWYNLYKSNNFSEFENILKDKILKTSFYPKVKIISVQDKNGSVYNLGDIIRIFESSCRTYNKVYKIMGFRWNKNKTHLCVITSQHNYGIRLDWVEHYVEKKPDFILPKRWCIKRNMDNYRIINDWCNNNPIHNEKMSYRDSAGYIYSEQPPDSSAFFKRKTHMNIFSIHPDYQEITFEQFKQYVLFNGFKIGDCFDKQKTLSGEIIKVNKKQIIDLQYINGQSVAFYKCVK